jgi:hypothetical protein
MIRCIVSWCAVDEVFNCSEEVFSTRFGMSGISDRTKRFNVEGRCCNSV